MGAVTLAKPTLLSERFELLSNSGGSNGAGGRLSSSWAVEATVRGRRYTRAVRNTDTETMQAGKQSDANVVEIALETATLDGAWRVRSIADQSVYEIVSLSRQDGVAFVHAREVA